MATKDMGHEPQQITQFPQDEEEQVIYQWVYVTHQGQDIDVQVTPADQQLFTIDTPWYRAQVRTYDLLDSVVRFCQAMYGSGTLNVIIS
ncbi:MAG: hypothetical protein ACFFCH_05535 [Promethearchaeota archaeon]